MMISRRWLQLCGVAAVIFLAGKATISIADEAPAGLVMAISGSATPPLSLMGEIPANTPEQLAPGTRLTFLHYGRCKLVTVTSGTLTLNRNNYTSDGNVDGETDGPCPRFHQIGGAGQVSGGLVARGGGVPRWPLSEEIIVAGNGTDGIRAGAIFAADDLNTPLLRLDVSAHRLRFSPNSGRPALGGRYVLRLTMPGDSKPLDIPFIGTAPTSSSLLIVIRER
jgi:hypothetical protein